MRFRKLLEPIEINGMKLRNRLVMPGMGTRLTKDGYATPEWVRHYEERARGGIGLIMTEAIGVEYPEAATYAAEGVGVDDDVFLPGLKSLTDAVHGHGARIVLQLHHAGPRVKPTPASHPVAASPITVPGRWGDKGNLSRELTKEDIKRLIGVYVDAADRGKRAGFDAVEIHAAHWYLLNSFLSPYWNHRIDEYGGSLENRSRFLLEIVAAVRSRVGSDYPMFCRLNGQELEIGASLQLLTGGVTLEEAIQTARMLEDAGIDALDISAHPPVVPFLKPGSRAYMAEAIKKAVKVPVLTTGMIVPKLAERLVADGAVDLVAMGRQILCDPEIPIKLAQGRESEIRPCLSCNVCRDRAISRRGQVHMLPHISCTLNSAVGTFEGYDVKSAAIKKGVVIVGGGPAGMEAARVAALRGHSVTLIEKRKRLGGSFLLAGMLHDRYANAVEYYVREMSRLGIATKVDTIATPELIESLKPDVLVLAWGSQPAPLRLSGGDKKNVVTSSEMLLMMEGQWPKGKALTLRRLLWWLGLRAVMLPFGPRLVRRAFGMIAPFGKDVVILGNDLAGLEIGSFLSEHGKKVTVLAIGSDIQDGLVPAPMNKLREVFEHSIKVHGGSIPTELTFAAITRNGVEVIEPGGRKKFCRADTIFVAEGYLVDPASGHQFQTTVPEIHVIGDAADPAGIYEAVHSGFDIGRLI